MIEERQDYLMFFLFQIAQKGNDRLWKVLDFWCVTNGGFIHSPHTNKKYTAACFSILYILVNVYFVYGIPYRETSWN